MTEKFPTPWCVGPFGDIWVAADVELRDGKWRETCQKPRLVLTFAGHKECDGLAEQIVNAVNAAALTSQNGGSQ